MEVEGRGNGKRNVVLGLVSDVVEARVDKCRSDVWRQGFIIFAYNGTILVARHDDDGGDQERPLAFMLKWKEGSADFRDTEIQISTLATFSF